MNDFGRVVACGSISGYDVPPEQRFGVRNLFHVVAKSITYRGFVSAAASSLACVFFPAKTRGCCADHEQGQFPGTCCTIPPPL